MTIKSQPPCPFCDGTGTTREGYVCGHCMAPQVVPPMDRHEETCALSVPLRIPHQRDEPPQVAHLCWQDDEEDV